MGDRFGFVILNYGTMDETIECVRSIGKHVKEEHEIVIIDNASDRMCTIHREACQRRA